MIAILEDSKGFRRSIDFPKFSPQICLPIFKHLTAFDNIEELTEPCCDKVTFTFDKWLELEEIALYKEDFFRHHCHHCNCAGGGGGRRCKL